MKMKRTVTAFLLLAMILMLFAGCGSSSSSSDSDTVEEETTEEASETTEEEEEAEEEEEETEEAEEAAEEETVEEEETETEEEAAEEATEEEAAEEAATSTEIELPLTTNGESYSYFVSYPGIMSSYFEEPFYDYPAWVELEERTGVHIEWYTVSVDSETENFNLMISSGDYTDIFSSSLLTNTLDYYVEEDVIRDLKDDIQTWMPNYMSNIEEYPEFAESIGSESDEGYWSVLHNYTMNTTYQGGLVIRKDWLDELGLDMPQTVDEYYEVLTAFKTELGADSALWINSDGLLGNDYFSSCYGISTWYNNSGTVQYPIYQVDGVVKYGPAEEGYYEYLSLMAKWYSEGLIYQDFMTYTSSNTNAPSEIITTDNCGVYVSQLTNLHQYDDQVEGIDVVGAYTPVLEEGDSTHIDWSLSGVSSNGICISTAVDDDELPLLLQMWDYTCSDEGFLLQNYGIEGVSYEVIDGTPTFTEVVTDGEIPAFSLAMNAYALGDTAVGIIDSTRQWVTYSDKQIETAAIWAENVDDDYALPDLMTLNTEETETFNTYFTDILTHVNTFTLSVIVGNTELNEDTWNDYLDALESMGLSTCIEQYQSAYDRYISK